MCSKQKKIEYTNDASKTWPHRCLSTDAYKAERAGVKIYENEAVFFSEIKMKVYTVVVVLLHSSWADRFELKESFFMSWHVKGGI